MHYDQHNRAFRDYVDTLITFFQNQPDKYQQMIKSEKQLEAVKTIIDGGFDWTYGFELELCSCHLFVKRRSV